MGFLVTGLAYFIGAYVRSAVFARGAARPIARAGSKSGLSRAVASCRDCLGAVA